VVGSATSDGPEEVEEGMYEARDSNSSMMVEAIQVFLSADSGPPHSSRTAMVKAGHRSRMARTPRAKMGMVG